MKRGGSYTGVRPSNASAPPQKGNVHQKEGLSEQSEEESSLLDARTCDAILMSVVPH